MRNFLLGLTGFFVSVSSYGQTCTASSQVTTDVNITSISWTAVAGGASPSLTATDCANIAAGTNTTTVADFFVDFKNGVTVTISNNITIHGNFDIPSGATGDNIEIDVTGGHTLSVTGDLGDNSNNNVTYNVVSSTDKITVGGTLFGKDNQAFIGAGTISGGTLNIKNGGSCGSPCPVSGGFPNCTAGGPSPNFCATYGVPVVLTSFGASVNPKGVSLRWTTASEINFDYFSLQRSGDGTAFNEIAQVRGHGTTNELHNYSYEDNDPFIGRSYYRLTSNDFDGYQETFKVVSVEYYGEKKFHVSPNPSDGSSVKLNFNFETDADGLITVYDNMGSVIGSYPLGTGSISFEGNLRSGVYLAKYTSASFTKTERFMVK